jgi:hypothetical protein
MSSLWGREWRCGQRTIIENKLNIFLYIKYLNKINANVIVMELLSIYLMHCNFTIFFFLERIFIK